LQYDELTALIKKELLRTGVPDYELFYLSSDNLTIELKDKKVDSLEKAIDKSISLRVLKDGRIGFSYCTKFSGDGIKKMVENAFHTSLNTKVDECNGFAKKNYDTLPKTDDYDNRIKDIPFEKKVDALRALEEAAYGYDKRVKSARKLEFVQSLKQIRVLNSLGIECSHKKTVFSFSAMVAASEKDESEIGWESDFSSYYDRLDYAAIGKTAAKKACDRLNGRVIKSERMPVVLDRLVSSELLSVLATSFYADYIIKNKSTLKGKIGKKIFSENINLVDDPFFDDGIATFPFDAEGSLSTKTDVVQNGVLMSYLSDTYTSKKMGILNTSNSIKGSLFAPPSVGNTNFYLMPGKDSKDELIKNMKRGLVITDAMGLHTANPISGDFSIGISGFFVDDGEISFPVRGLVFSGNIFDVLNDVIEVANDLKFYDKSAAPSVLIGKADIAGE
jgi:PmbA protein